MTDDNGVCIVSDFTVGRIGRSKLVILVLIKELAVLKRRKSY